MSLSAVSPVPDPAATAVGCLVAGELAWQDRAADADLPRPGGLGRCPARAEAAATAGHVVEILALKQQLAEAQEGKRFLLQGGDCAENFSDCESGTISNRLKVLLQMSLVLVHGLRQPVIASAAGQYAKPRSADTETRRRDPAQLPRRRDQCAGIHRGGAPARSEAHAAGARAFGDDDELRARADRWGFRRSAPPEYWNLEWVSHSPLAAEYQKMVASIGDAVHFMETLAGARVHNLNRIDFYTSHEALLLPYEQALTRQVPRASRAG